MPVIVPITSNHSIKFIECSVPSWTLSHLSLWWTDHEPFKTAQCDLAFDNDFLHCYCSWSNTKRCQKKVAFKLRNTLKAERKFSEGDNVQKGIADNVGVSVASVYKIKIHHLSRWWMVHNFRLFFTAMWWYCTVLLKIGLVWLGVGDDDDVI